VKDNWYNIKSVMLQQNGKEFFGFALELLTTCS